MEDLVYVKHELEFPAWKIQHVVVGLPPSTVYGIVLNGVLADDSAIKKAAVGTACKAGLILSCM
jgi:hypothetical protein